MLKNASNVKQLICDKPFDVRIEMIFISNKRGDLDTLGKAIVYVTFSKNKSENEEIVHTAINEQNEQRSQQAQRKDLASYK